MSAKACFETEHCRAQDGSAGRSELWWVCSPPSNFLNSKVFSLSRHAHVLAGLSYCPPYLRAIPQPGRAYLGKVLQDQRKRAKMSEGMDERIVGCKVRARESKDDDDIDKTAYT